MSNIVCIMELESLTGGENRTPPYQPTVSPHIHYNTLLGVSRTATDLELYVLHFKLDVTMLAIAAW